MTTNGPRTVLNLAWAVFGALHVISWHQKARPIPIASILPELRREPRQTATDPTPFAFSYRGRPYNVKPLAAYDLAGLVVSHNDIGGLADIYHTKDSLDTKDVCVIWGDNVATEDFHRVKFWNGPWTCHWRYPDGVRTAASQVSNNHLITQSDSIRQAIARVRVGDQIRVRGRLVAYQDAAHAEFWRTSSLTRGDTGNGACEVVFVENLEILKAGAPGWWTLYLLSLGGLGALAALELVRFFRGD